jgi:hypothetical protein
MLPISPRSILFAALALVLLPSCSSEADTAAAPTGAGAPEFSQPDKIAARALSLSNAGSAERAESPRAQAVLCSQALEGLSVRLRDSGTLNEMQLQALGQAKAVYDRRIRGVGNEPARAGGGSSALEQAIEEEEEGEANPAEQARVAIGCLQDLQTAG